MSPTLWGRHFNGGHKRHEKRRMGDGDPIEHFPRGTVLELHVENRNVGISIAQSVNRVFDPDRSNHRVVARSECLLEGITDDRVVLR